VKVPHVAALPAGAYPGSFSEISGRHEETRTPDLYRVKVAL
jgi:hypothetical protein